VGSGQEPESIVSLRELLQRLLDEALREQSGLSLCTALCVRLEGDRFVMSSAGDLPPLVVRDDGRVRELGGSGPLLGGWEASAWEDRTVSVREGETRLMYTDGVTDTRVDGERFGSARLRRLLGEHAGDGPKELLAALEAALDRFQTEGHSDGTGAVALRPASAAANAARAGAHASVAAGESLPG
jgi:stage II sporulation SpoE-like protein